MSKNLRNSTAAAITIFSALLLTVGSASVQLLTAPAASAQTVDVGDASILVQDTNESASVQLLTAPAASAQTVDVGDASILVPDAKIAVLVRACKSSTAVSGCGAAMQALIEALMVANPTASISTIFASIASKIAFDSNSVLNGTKRINRVVLTSMLSALSEIASSNGLTALQNTIVTVAKLVAAGEEVDLKAVATGNTFTLGDTVASPA